MSLEPEKIQQSLEDALRALAESTGERLVQQIRPILFANLDRGRLQRYIEENLDRVPAYVEQVANQFAALHGRLHQLQHERKTEVWGPLFIRMQTWAYRFFCRKGFTPGMETQQIAEECATDAALTLLNAYFPYDTDFDAWAHIIVQNACRKYIERAFKKSVVPGNQIVDLDDNLVGLSDLLQKIQANELEEELTGALAQLTEARRTVIQLIYFEELPADEAAQRMGKTVGAVYSLQFHALEDLRKILSTIRDNLNE